MIKNLYGYVLDNVFVGLYRMHCMFVLEALRFQDSRFIFHGKSFMMKENEFSSNGKERLF